MVEDRVQEDEDVDNFIWKELTGRQTRPEFNIRREFLEDDFQSTLDSFHMWAHFDNKIREVDSVLEDLYGEGNGVKAAALYGSEVSGLALSKNSLALRGSEDFTKGSDYDVLVLVEGAGEAGRNKAQKELTSKQKTGEPGISGEEFNPVVYTVEEFERDLEEALQQPETLEELEEEIGDLRDIEQFRQKVEEFDRREGLQKLDELAHVESLEELEDELGQLDGSSYLGWNKVTINMPTHEFDLNYVKRMRSLLTGYILHEEFDQEVITGQVEKAKNALLDENGQVRDDTIEYFLAGSTGYEDRINEFIDNDEKAKLWWTINNSEYIDIPRKYEINEEGYAVDALMPEEMTADQTIHAISEDREIRGEQTELSEYDAGLTGPGNQSELSDYHKEESNPSNSSREASPDHPALPSH